MADLTSLQKEFAKKYAQSGDYIKAYKETYKDFSEAKAEKLSKDQRIVAYVKKYNEASALISETLEPEPVARPVSEAFPRSAPYICIDGRGW